MADTVNIKRRGLQRHVNTSQEKLLTIAKKYMKEEERGPKEFKKDRKEERQRDWEEKPLHGRFLRCTEGLASSETWNWLRKGDLKKETKGLIIAAQDQSLRTNAFKAKVKKANVSPLCRMCKAAEETVFHLVSECSTVAQSEYKERHDKLAKVIHWDLYGLVCNLVQSGMNTCRKR